ncbi:hypothetical protein VKT23_006565 [Stygiomarasmius scandens]|uniref:Uncharacterized protein n=1 Tax=Marasmiellus scandens TaxID=2682957 RepID=A0ABR1JQQ3_9AGAR
MKKCEALPLTDKVGNRQTTPTGVTVVNLDVPDGLDYPAKAAEKGPYPNIAESPPLLYPAIHDYSVLLTSIIPIGASLIACVISGILGDRYAVAMILLGVVANGLTCLVLGSGILTVKRVKPASGVPKGDGLLESKKELVVLLGPESAVAQVTRASFGLQFPEWSTPNYHDVGVCCILQTSQFLIQLLLIPQAELFGQFMFLITFAVSWLYNAYLSSFDKEEMQRKVLLRDDVLKINGELKRYQFGTRTALAVFVTFVLQPSKPQAMLDHLIPNNTDVWNTFKKQVAGQVNFEGDELNIDFGALKTEGENGLMDDLEDDAREAYRIYREYCASRKTEEAKKPVEEV